jgi:hypothetical protein
MALSNPCWGSARIREQELSLRDFPNLQFCAQFDFRCAYVRPQGRFELLRRIVQRNLSPPDGTNRGIRTLLRGLGLRPHLFQRLIERPSSIGKRLLSGLGGASGGVRALYGSIGAPGCLSCLPDIHKQSSTAHKYQSGSQGRISTKQPPAPQALAVQAQRLFGAMVRRIAALPVPTG